jgi:predicted flap endonuclease-1-like 5' DNA nuclease
VDRVVEVEKIVEVERIVEVEKIVEIIHEIEIIREVPIEIIREIEVTREVDMESLMAMISQMTTVEVSRSTKETESVIERIAAVSIDEEIVETIIPLQIKPDNLVVIEGIGPKIAELLNNDGIFTFWQLAQTDVARLREILNAAGSRFQMHNPGTWSEQSLLAAEGKMSELKQLQIELNAGKKA